MYGKTEQSASDGKLPKWVVPTAIGSCVAVVGLVIFSTYISYSATEARLRNAIAAKVKSNEAEFDNMFKKIAQVAQISQKQEQAIIALVTGHAEARGGIKGGGFVNMLTESIPNQTMGQYEKLSAIVVASRNGWTMRQAELADLGRAHNDCLTVPLSAWFVGGREPIKITIVSSTRTKRAMDTGIDDDIDLFKN